MQFTRTVLPLLAFCLAGHLPAQELNNASLVGRFGFRHFHVNTSNLAAPVMQTAWGILTFDGRGGVAWTGQRLVAAQPAAALSGSGTYTLASSGALRFTSPLAADQQVQSWFSQMMIAGSSHLAENTADCLMAVSLGPAASNTAVLNGPYTWSSIEFPEGRASTARTWVARTVAASASLQGFEASGLSLGQRRTQTVMNTALNIADGLGSFTIPGSASLLQGAYSFYVSRDGSAIVGGGSAHGLMAALRNPASGAANSSLTGTYSLAGFRFEGGSWSAYNGMAGIRANGQLVQSQRIRTSEGPLSFTGVQNFQISSNGSGTLQSQTLAIANDGQAWLTHGLSVNDANNYEVSLAFRAPSLTAPAGSAPWLSPLGVLNAASFAPAAAPLAPGSFITIFGSGLGPATPAIAPPGAFPARLANVEVLVDGRPAPLYAVSATQVSAILPSATTGPLARIRLSFNGQRSNEVEIPVSTSSPGIFTIPSGGLGAGALLRTDFSLISAARPAIRGQAAQIYLTGLGAVNPAVVDGVPPSLTVLSRTRDTINVYVGGRRAQVLFAGAAPGLPGLYQVNIIVPADAPVGMAALAIETPTAFQDMADIPVAP
jgi:uncharacterized protein (TIGR03437 family)